jgi:hypothetical protein
MATAAAITVTAHRLTASEGPPQQGAAPMTLVGPLPLPVVDARLVRTPVQYNFSPEYQDYVVPSDKRLVIEFVSGTCEVEAPGRTTAGYIRTTVGSLTIAHAFVPVFTASTADTNILVFSQSTRLYADPGTELSATISIYGGSGSCSSFAFSGYLTNP